MPELTVRAFGEMIHIPLYEQLRILVEQKYPQQAPAVFRVPYYGPAMTAIREYYRRGNDAAVLDAAVGDLGTSNYVRSRVDHNIAVLQAFRRGRQGTRPLVPRVAGRHLLTVAGLDLRFRSDLVAVENGQTRYILFNFRAADPTTEVAKTILELACHVLSSEGTGCQPREFEFISIRSDRVQRISQVRRSTLNRARQNARAILRLWPTI